MAENSQNSNSNPMDDFLAQSDALNPARIEQPGPIPFNFNEPKPVINPIYPIKDYSTGASPNYYPSQVKANAPNNPEQSIDALFNDTMNKINGAQDRNNYGYAFGYDSGPKGTFRDRIKGYGQETFNKIGFSPLIDNEAWFNSKTTFSDDLSRWWNHSAWPMMSKGFMDPIKSYASVINGDGLFNADEQSARDYEYYNAIGQSSKGGLGGFAVNLFNSASYSMGILTEGVVESILIEGLTGAAGPGGGLAAAGFGLGKFVNKLSQVPKGLYNTAKGAVKLAETMKDYSQLSKAKDLFKTASSNFGNFANPLSNTSRALFSQNINNINDLARASKTAGAFWHDMMVMNLALSEGKLEGGFTKYQTYDRLYNEYVADPENNGQAPSLEEQENMMKEATKASFWNTLNNTALIFYSNKLVFPSLANASFLKGAPKFGFGTVLGDINKEYQLVFNPGKNIAKSTFSKEKIGLVNAIKSLGRPATYGKVGLNYFKANVVEGAQESLQDVLQDATQNYYVSTYKNNAAKNFFYGAGLVGDAIKKQFSAQGAETFLSGFLMGSILQAPSKMKSYMTMGYNDYFKKDAQHKTYMEEREAAANEVVDHMNTMWENSHYLFDPRMTNYATQALLYDTVGNPEENTTKEIHDTKFTAFQTAVISSLQRGTFDMFIKHYENYKQATPQDIEEAWHLKPGQGAKALENFGESLETAKKIAYRWGQAKENLSKYQADLNNYEKDSYQYKMAEIYNQAFSQSLFNYVFLQGAFDDTSARVSKLYSKLAQLPTIKNSNFADFAGFTDPNRLQREIEMMKTDIETLEQSGVPMVAEDLERKRKLLEIYSDFKEKQDALVSSYITKERFSALTERILNENPDLTKEQLNLNTIEKLIQQFDEGKSNEFTEYKESFKNLLFGLAKTDEEKLQLQQEINSIKGGMDSLFDDLLDTHILKHEKNKLAPLINILSNPNDFYDHLLRNFQWMKNLYQNKKNIIKDIVNSEISNIERNTLLNELADQKIFVDLDEFAKWVENPMYRPEGFIDVTNNAYIPEGSLLYDKYYEIFERAAQLESTKPAGDSIPDAEVLQDIIDDLTKDRDKRLDLAKQKFEEALKNKYDATEAELRKLAEEALNSVQEDLESEQAKLDVYKEWLSDLESLTGIEKAAAGLVNADLIDNQQLLDATDAIFDNPDLTDTLIELRDKIMKANPEMDADNAIRTAGFYLSTKPLIEDLIKEQQSVVDNFVAPDFINVEQTPEWEQYQKELTDINNEYEAQVKEAKLDFVESGGNPTDVREYSIKDQFEDYPDDLQEELNGVFDDFLLTKTSEPGTLKQDDPGRYNTLRERWMENDPVAQDILDKYNEKTKQEAIKNARVGLTPPKLLFGDAVIEPGTPLSNITDLYMKYEEAVRTKELKSEDGKSVKKLTVDDIKAIKEDMKAIASYIDSKEKAFKLKPIAQEIIEKLETTIFNRQNELVLSVDEEGFESRRFRDSKPEDPRPERATEVAALMEQDLEEKDPFLFNKLKDNSIQNLFREVVLDNTIGSLEERIDAFLASLRNYDQFKSDLKIAGIKESLMADQSIGNLESAVKKYSFKESSDAGINLDALIRQFLTLDPRGGFVKVNYDSVIDIRGTQKKVSDLMSKDAYDFMFHPVTGSATRFRRNMIDGGYQLFTNDVKVFDRNARGGRGVTGELDLLLIDTEGNLAVVDIKAAGASTWKNLGVPFKLDSKTGKQLTDDQGQPIRNNANKKTYFRAQQSIYGNSIYTMSGLEAALLLYPIEMSVTMDGYIKTLNKPKADLTKNNTLSENGMFIILEPIGEETMQRFGFERTPPSDTVELPQMGEQEVPIRPGAIPVSDPEKTTLNDFLNQDVIYQGKIGKLVNNSDGGFSVEVNQNGIISQYDINVSGKNVKDGAVNIIKAGLSPITATESVGQVTQIAGQTINARFLDKSEKTAEINGVTYTINRDTTGAIVSLSYNTNDKEIAETQKEIDALSREIGLLQKEQRETRNKTIQRDITAKIFEVNRLTSKKTDLINKNKKRTRRGGNTDDLIFALNRLPNRFQKQVPSGEPTDREDQVKLIAQLSESESVTREIDFILYSHGMPRDVENFMAGQIDDLTSSKQRQIEDWGVELIIKLEEYQNRLVNEGRSTVPVDNVIEAVNETLNNLASIKFFKNGKITKASRKEFERRTKVQQRTNVPSVQKSTGAATEGVSGQAVSGEELTNLIQESRKKIQGIKLNEFEKDLAILLPDGRYEVILNYYSDFDNNINAGIFTKEEALNQFGPSFITVLESPMAPNVKELEIVKSQMDAMFDNATLENIKQIYFDAVVKFIYNEDSLNYPLTNMLDEIFKNKLDALEEDMSLDNLTEGTELVNIEPFKTFKKINEAFVVKSINKQAQTVEIFSPIRKKSYTFTEQEIKTNFMKPSDKPKAVEEIVITPQIKENIKSTEENIATLGKSDKLDEIESENKNLTPEERMNNIINIFNQC
jgi:hypothetical protein